MGRCLEIVEMSVACQVGVLKCQRRLSVNQDRLGDRKGVFLVRPVDGDNWVNPVFFTTKRQRFSTVLIFLKYCPASGPTSRAFFDVGLVDEHNGTRRGKPY